MKLLRLILLVCVIWITGCVAVGNRNAEFQMIPPRGLGEGLPSSSEVPIATGLRFDAVYLIASFVTGRDDPHVVHSFARFWPDGRAAFQSAPLRAEEELSQEHADNMNGAFVGRYSVMDDDVFMEVYQLISPHKWGFRIHHFRMDDHERLVYVGSKRRGQQRWTLDGRHVLRVDLPGLTYRPSW